MLTLPEHLIFFVVLCCLSFVYFVYLHLCGCTVIVCIIIVCLLENTIKLMFSVFALDTCTNYYHHNIEHNGSNCKLLKTETAKTEADENLAPVLGRVQKCCGIKSDRFVLLMMLSTITV